MGTQANTFFPFTIAAYDNGHFVELPRGFTAAMQEWRPNGVSYYAFDVTIKSPTEVTFTLYGMKDMCYGGIGEKLCDVEATVNRSTTSRAIDEQATRLAIARRTAELRRAEEALIAAYAKEIRTNALKEVRKCK